MDLLNAVVLHPGDLHAQTIEGKLSPASGTRPNCSMTQPLTDTISESVLRWK